MAQDRFTPNRGRDRFFQRDRRSGDYDDDVHETRAREPYGTELDDEGGYYNRQSERGRARGGSYIPRWQDYRQGNAGDYDESYDSRRYGDMSHSYGGEQDRYPAGYSPAPEYSGRGRWSREERQQRFGTYGGQHRGRGPKGYSRSDERIREDINDRLTDDEWIDATEIDVMVRSGEVTLNGTVDSRDDKRRAEDIAYDAIGVRDVQNNLRVQSKGAGDSSRQ